MNFHYIISNDCNEKGKMKILKRIMDNDKILKTELFYCKESCMSRFYKTITGRKCCSHEFRDYEDIFYYQDNERNKNSIVCECGGKYIHKHKSKHLKTNKHMKFIDRLLNGY